MTAKIKSSSEQKVFDEFKVTPADYFENVVVARDYKTYNISPRVDASCGGGIKEGSVVLVSGDEKLGKSTFCLQACKVALSMNDVPHRKAFYFDIENKLQTRDLNISGFNMNDEDFHVIGSEEGKLLTAETVFKMIEKLCITEKNSIFIIDSVSMLLTESELNYEFDKTYRADVPRLTSIFLRKIVQVLRPSRNTLFCILQKMANQNASGPMAPQTKEGGGKKLQYAANYKFSMTYKQDILEGDTKIGHKVYFKCPFHPSSDICSPESHFYHTFNYGIDEVKEIIELAAEQGVIQKKGAWYVLNDGSKVQGLDNLTLHLKNSPDELDFIRKQMLELKNEN